MSAENAFTVNARRGGRRRAMLILVLAGILLLSLFAAGGLLLSRLPHGVTIALPLAREEGQVQDAPSYIAENDVLVIDPYDPMGVGDGRFPPLGVSFGTGDGDIPEMAAKR